MVGNLGDVAMERKRDELLKILLSDVRYPGLKRSLLRRDIFGVS